MRPTTPAELEAYNHRKLRIIWILTGVVAALCLLAALILLNSRP